MQTETKNKPAFSITRFAKSLQNAFNGLFWVFTHERNMQLHAVAALLAVLFGIWLRVSGIEWAVLCLTIGSVMAAEAFNSAIEQLTDMVSPDFNPKAGLVKDLAAGAVTLVAISAVAVAIGIFAPKIWSKYLVLYFS